MWSISVSILVGVWRAMGCEWQERYSAWWVALQLCRRGDDLTGLQGFGGPDADAGANSSAARAGKPPWGPGLAGARQGKAAPVGRAAVPPGGPTRAVRLPPTHMPGPTHGAWLQPQLLSQCLPGCSHTTPCPRARARQATGHWTRDLPPLTAVPEGPAALWTLCDSS